LWIAERAGVPRVSSRLLRIEMLRSLDAIHLATAHELRAELTAFVCYDKRLRDSAHALGLPVEAPPDPAALQPVP
jgi:uncharacterized protein